MQVSGNEYPAVIKYHPYDKIHILITPSRKSCKKTVYNSDQNYILKMPVKTHRNPGFVCGWWLFAFYLSDCNAVLISVSVY